MGHLKGGATVSGYRVWHAGNDGEGSGLNADLLDGYHKDWLRDWSNILNKPSLLSLGTTSSTAYRGDHGLIAYNHATTTATNPHGTTKADVGLGSAENKSSATIRGEITSSNVTTALGFTPEQSFTKNNAFNKNFGTVAGTVAQGNDSRFHAHSNKTVLDNTTASYTTAEETKLAGIATGANNYSHPTGAGNNHIPSGGAANNFLKYSSSGVAAWSAVSFSELVNVPSEFTPADHTHPYLPLSGGELTGDLTMRSTGPLTFWIDADTDNVTETDTVTFKLTQDGGIVGVQLGIDSANNSYLKNIYNSSGTDFYIKNHDESLSGKIWHSVNFDPSSKEDNLTFSGSGATTVSRSGNTITISSTDTNTNTWRGIHDSPVDGATTTSISSNWANDHSVATGSGSHVPTGGTTSQYLRGDGSWQTLNKSAVGLGNVDNVKQEPAFTKNTAFNKNFGTTTGTVAEGNHIHGDYQTHILTQSDGAAQAVPNGDWNDAIETGFYMFSSGTNEPPPTDAHSWWYGMVIKHNSHWVTQQLTDFENKYTYIRNMQNGTWGEWKQISGVTGFEAVRKGDEQTDFKTYKSGKDSEGIFTIIEYKRNDGTLLATSTLSGGTSPNYTTRTIKYYATNGTTLEKTTTRTLSYDSDGVLISEV